MTFHFLIKLFISAFIIALSSELVKRSTFVAALLISLPLTSIIAIVWTYYENRSPEKVIALSNAIFFMVLPSLLFFILLPLLMKSGIKFEYALGISMFGTAVFYALYTILLKKFGIFI